MSRATIEIINYDPNFDELKLSNEIVPELFWCVVQKVTEKSKENKLHFYRNLVHNSVNEVNLNPTEMRNYCMLVSKVSATHLKVLQLIDGVLDYFAHARISPPNTILDTLNTLDKNIEFTIPELRGKYEKISLVFFDIRFRKEVFGIRF